MTRSQKNVLTCKHTKSRLATPANKHATTTDTSQKAHSAQISRRKEGTCIYFYTVAGHLKAGVEVTRVAHVPEAFPARHGLAVHPVPVQLLRPKPVPPTESKQQTPKQQQRRRRNMI